jgi:hypothetical protein
MEGLVFLHFSSRSFFNVWPNKRNAGGFIFDEYLYEMILIFVNYHQRFFANTDNPFASYNLDHNYYFDFAHFRKEYWTMLHFIACWPNIDWALIA